MGGFVPGVMAKNHQIMLTRFGGYFTEAI